MVTAPVMPTTRQVFSPAKEYFSLVRRSRKASAPAAVMPPSPTGGCWGSRDISGTDASTGIFASPSRSSSRRMRPSSNSRRAMTATAASPPSRKPASTLRRYPASSASVGSTAASATFTAVPSMMALIRPGRMSAMASAICSACTGSSPSTVTRKNSVSPTASARIRFSSSRAVQSTPAAEMISLRVWRVFRITRYESTCFRAVPISPVDAPSAVVSYT